MSEEYDEATRDLVEFVTKYNELVWRQLENVRECMADTVGSVMTSIQQISTAQMKQTSKADSVFVKEGTKEEFKEVSVKNVEEEEIAKIPDEKVDYSGDMIAAGKRFRGHMESLGSLDSRVENLLMTMIGSLSSDDVVGQRLTHVQSAMRALNGGLTGIIKKYDKNFNVNEVRKISKEIQEEVFKSYTTEEEKELFFKIYGSRR